MKRISNKRELQIMPGKKKYYRRKVFTSAEYKYRKLVLDAVIKRPETRYVYNSIRDCGRWFASNAFGPYRCGHQVCPDCRHHYKTHRIGSVMTRIAPWHKTHVFFCTVLFDARKLLSDDVFEPLKKGRTFDTLKVDLKSYRARLYRPFDVAGLDGLQIAGSFEFAVKQFKAQGKNADHFTRSCLDTAGLPQPKIGDRHFHVHCHFLLCAVKDGKFLTAHRLRKLLKGKFPLPAQVKVQPLKNSQTKQQAIAGCCGYSHKGHIGNDITPEEIRDLVLALEALGRKRLGINLSRGTLKPTSKAATRKKVATISSGKPSWKSVV